MRKGLKRKGTLSSALLVLLLIIITLMIGIVKYGLDAQVPISIACGILIIYGMYYLGIEWVDLQSSIIKSISTSLECMLIILMIGATVGTWVSSGMIPYIIVLGLKIFSPKFFLVSILIICAIMSMITGSSWTTIGTIGVAFMGVGIGLGMNPAITAGAIICGAYFGDKQSPLSDSTNFAAAVAKTDLYKHVKSMLFTTGPSLLISAFIFLFLGLNTKGKADISAIDEIINGLNQTFHFTPILLIPLIIMVILIVVKFPAIPTLLLCSILGALMTMLFQNSSFTEVGNYWYSGFVGQTNNDVINRLLTRGGFSSMYYTISLMLVSLTMAGLMECCGIIDIIMSKLKYLTNNRVGLIVSNLFSGYCLSFIASDPYLSMLLSANAFGEKYDNLNLDRSVLSRTLEDSGTIVAPMVPWGSNGVYCAVTLGVTTMAYLPYYFMGLINPIVAVVCAIIGFGMIKAKRN